MSSRVYFRFSSSTDFDFVAFDGGFITIGELKYLISKKTGVLKDRNTVIELFDSRTGDEYVDTSAMVPKNASVVAKRSPVVRPPPISALTTTPATAKKTATPLTKEVPKAEESESKVEENVDDGLGPGVFAPDMTEEAPDDDAAISEFVKNVGEVWRTDLSMQPPWRRGRGRDLSGRGGRRGPMRMGGRANLPPMGYVCHRCNTPGHFIEECPTNGDPAYDFVRVRYPTGIPSSMLEKDDQGGLLMPNGERARLKPNMEKFKQEMAGVPVGEPSVKQLTAGPAAMGEALTDQGFEELAAMMARNPLTTLTPLMMSILPQARPIDIRRGFFSGQPFDRQTFQQCREEHDRAKAAYEGTPAQHPPVWSGAAAAAPPSNPSHFDNAQWRHPSQPPPQTEMFPDGRWPQKGPSYTGYAPPEKAGYFEHHPPWHPRAPPLFYSPGFPQPPPFPPDQRYSEGEAEQGPARAPVVMETAAPALSSKVVRLHEHPSEEQRPDTSESSRRSREPAPEAHKSLPYGFEKSLQIKAADESGADSAQRRTQTRSASLEKSHRRRLERRASSDRSSPSNKKAKVQKKIREKTHHRTKDKERRRSRRDNLDRASSPQLETRIRRHSRIDEDDGLDRWELDNAMHEDDAYMTADMADSRFKRRSSEKRSSRSRSERTRRVRREQDL